MSLGGERSGPGPGRDDVADGGRGPGAGHSGDPAVEARRWTLYVCPVGHVYAGKDADDAPSTCQGPGMLAGWCRCRLEAIEVMAVSEHERLREAAQAAVAVVRAGWYPAIDRLRTALSSASSPSSRRPGPGQPPAPHAPAGQTAPAPPSSKAKP
jgi:hypothetical protein